MNKTKPAKNSEVLVVIPAFNEEQTLPGVIRDLKEHGYFTILVVDDGSGDATSAVAKENDVMMVRHVVNRGLGAALGTGFSFAKQNNFNYLVTFDGDGQHEGRKVKKLLEPIISNQADVVIGSRLIDRKSAPFKIRVLNYIANLITFVLYGVWTTDSLSGLRAFNKVALEKIHIKTDRMEVSNEFFKEIRRNKLRFIEVPIKAIYTDYSKAHTHNLDPWSVGFKMVLRLFR